MIFRSGYEVTQGFGIEKTSPNWLAHYQRFGLLGHEGLDVVPNEYEKIPMVQTDFDGLVVKVNTSNLGDYGRFVEIWVKELNTAFMYCHLSKNCVAFGEKVTRGEIIGIMGGTALGKENGVALHVHISAIPTDKNGYRDYSNLRNGYGGLIDPEPFFKEK